MGTRRGRARTGALVWVTGAALAVPLVAAPHAATAATGTYPSPGSISIEDRNFNNFKTGTLTIPASGSTTTAPISPSGVPGNIVDLNIELTIEHQQLHLVDVILTGPGAQQVVLLRGAGADSNPNKPTSFDLTIDDQADGPLPAIGSPPPDPLPAPQTLGKGDYQPTVHPTPAPANQPRLSVFNNVSPNAAWTLTLAGNGVAGKVTRWALDYDTDNTSKPNPSTLVVPATSAGVADVNLTLHNFSHPRPSDVDIMLVAPGGQRRAVLMSNVGDAPGGAAGNLTLTLDDEALTQLPAKTALGSGAFQPHDRGSFDDDFPGAPDRIGAGSTLSTFDGVNPGGTWQLFVLDTYFGPGGNGSIAGGWSLQITTHEAPAAPVITAPANGGTDRDGYVEFSGTAPAGTTVQVLEAGVVRGATTANGSGTWTLFLAGVSDGTHTYVATASGAFGNTSGPSGAVTVVMDRVAPSGTVSIDGGAASTNRAAVTLHLAATDAAPSSGVTLMRFSNNAATWSPWEAYAARNAWTLPSGDGTKTVYAQFADRAGNLSGTKSDSIVLDSAAGPVAGGKDSTAPRVTSTSPRHRATKVKPSANVKAVFSEGMRASSLTRSTVRLVTPGGSGVKARVSYDAARRTVTINPRLNLARRTTYLVVISAVKDRAGNQLDQSPKAGYQPKTWRFTTR